MPIIIVRVIKIIDKRETQKKMKKNMTEKNKGVMQAIVKG